MTARLFALALAVSALTGCAEAERLARQTVSDAASTTVRSQQTSYDTAQGQNVRFSLGGAAFADQVASTNARISPVPADYGEARSALAWPDDASYTLGHGGSVTLEFRDNTLVDGPGADLVIFEIGDDVESMSVEISEDGSRFVRAGRVGGSESTLDISGAARPGAQYRFVRLTDDPEQGERSGSTPGADVDAVGAIHGQRR